jgi:uncharacterized repeat protein (TIGR01451 family)
MAASRARVDALPKRRWIPAVAAAIALAIASPASATNLTPTDNPLPGSRFQGADGNQDDAPGLSDWQGLQAAGRVQHSPDPNAQDSAFKDGSKEDEPGEWGLTTETDGVQPAKDNILDAWSSVDQPGADTFLYLGFSREEAEGTTFLTFELNQDARLWNNGRASIPCRRTGDVQVSYEPHGHDVAVVIRRWTTTKADTATGCAREGSLDDFAGMTANVDAQGALNAITITSRLPGSYVGTVAPELFGEASLNLASLVEKAFGDDCLNFASIWMHSRSSDSESSNLQDYVAPQPLAVRTCTASGTKFFDSNANGARDPGEPGIPRFLIWADYDNDGVHDAGEPFSVSDDQGEYVIYDIRPPHGTYMLREKLLPRRTATTPVATDWLCSYPNATTGGGTADAPDGPFGCAWGPIDVKATPNVQGRDFGNWFPARLTVRKEIEPADDPGRFDLLVNGNVVLPAAGDGASITISLPPGTYDVSERPADGTDPAAYRSTVECRRDVTRIGQRRSSVVFEDLPLSAGQQASCTFRNIRPGSPAIAIRKTGPALATAGDTLRYALLVTNPGDVPFPAGAVKVTDAACDGPPQLVSKAGASGPDATPGTLDPGDAWIYHCSKATSSGGTGCEPTRVDNTAVVTGTADSTTVTDDDGISTILLCPTRPTPPIEPVNPPGPEGPASPNVPGPVQPTGPSPPNAGDAAVAGIKFRQATRGCIRNRVPRVDFQGTRIAGVRVYINAQLKRRLTVQTLQRRVTPRVTLRPGRYRVTARVTFQSGSGTAPLTLSGTVRICAAAATPPRFTG